MSDDTPHRLMISCLLDAKRKGGGVYDTRRLDAVMRASQAVVQTKEHRLASMSLGKCDLHANCIDPNVLIDSGDMTHVCEKTDVINQESTGTCWMQAGLSFVSSVLAPAIKVHFSSAHLAFFDKLDKARTFLKFVQREHRAPDFERSLWHYLHDGPIQDGGTWNMFVHLVTTYGLVPQGQMPRTFQSTHTAHINKYLNRYLRSVARDVISGRTREEVVIRHVHRALLRAYGMPPESVHLNADVHCIAARGLSPLALPSLVDLTWDYTVLAHAPDREQGWYIGPYGNDPHAADLRQEYFYCTSIDTLTRCCVSQLAAKTAVWMTADVGYDFSAKAALACTELFDTDTLLGLETADTADKAARMRNRNTAPVHAMLFVGVKLVDGEPVHWLIQNSWGKTDAAKTGMIAASHRWFQEHVFQVAIHAAHVSHDVPQWRRHEAKQLKHWDVFATVAR